jgi:ribosomal protein S18 acetylase RimI-like enzyme
MSYFAMDPRPLTADDAAAARVLLVHTLGVTPYVDRALELLDIAALGTDPESRAMVIERDGTVAGLALYGAIAGAAGAVRLHLAIMAQAVDPADIGTRLLAAIVHEARAADARLLLAELPDDPVMSTTVATLRACGFREEARVHDFYRDGIALVFYRLALAANA